MIISRHNVGIRVAGIIIQDHTILLVAHKKKKQVYWLLPGGGVNYGESLEEALKREISEELNVIVEVGKPALICDSIEPRIKRHILNICFYCNCFSGEYKLGKDKRLYDFQFFTKDELTDLTIFPPINSHIISVLDRPSDLVYLGKLWLDTRN